MGQTIQINVYPGGEAQFVYSPEAAELTDGLGERITWRASDVAARGDSWFSDLTASGGPILGPFPLAAREAAIAAEIVWLNDRLLCGPLPLTIEESNGEETSNVGE
jgi:hypothetical protein